MKLWFDRKTGRVTAESCMFAGVRCATLAFAAERIDRVWNPGSGIIYEPERDYRHIPGSHRLELPENSAIPFLSDEELHPSEVGAILYPAPGANAVPGGVDGRALRFDAGDYFARHQVEVDYHSARIDFPVIEPWPEHLLPRLRAKLSRPASSIRLTAIGDSITEGWNATGFLHVSPHTPCYPEQFAQMLRTDYAATVDLRNRAVGGTGIRHADKIVQEWLADQPDLLLVAYGMNDLSSLSSDDFTAALEAIFRRTAEASPKTEILVVIGMEGNPSWSLTPREQSAAFAQAVRKMPERGHIAVADIARYWQELENRKSFFSLTGNGVNHPNDFGHRIYAGILGELISLR